MKKIFLFACIAIGSISKIWAQNTNVLMVNPPNLSPPIPIEVFAGDKGLVFQMILSKHLSPTSRFGFFNVTNFVGDYAVKNQKNQFVSQSFLTADLWNGLSANAGVLLNYMTGFRPTVGLQYVFANRKFLVIIFPRIDLTQTYNIENFGLVEYKPKLTKNWGIYTRVQGLYNRNIKFGLHDRSFVWLRAGATYKNFQFGIGNNIDYYGPQKIYENSFGVFAGVEIF